MSVLVALPEEVVTAINTARSNGYDLAMCDVADLLTRFAPTPQLAEIWLGLKRLQTQSGQIQRRVEKILEDEGEEHA